MNNVPRKRPRLAGEDRTELAAQLKRRYDAGESIRMLSAATGRSYGFVHRLLSEAGAELRGRGGPTRKA
ncbi:helix-turn-helix domain-containing protein [Nocardiopsis halotolerans]|uniref:helix-turn-helix domain-containing protein n=1 Tax=Nocardiopsis halotolerans TaxID=124252 RepID=UPI000348EAA9|nr:helix-turn-helix domain-containing protein [Nocardiopsis halotolerans]